MPSGPKKRKAAKKKQVKDSNSSSSSTPHSHPGESDGGEGELISPAAQDQQNHLLFTEGEVEKHEDGFSQNESVALGSDKKEEEGNIKIDKGSKPRKSDGSSSSSGGHSSDDESRIFDKNIVVLESAPVVELVQALPEKKAHEVEDSGVETSAVLDSVKLSDSLLKEEIVDEKSLVPEFNKQTFLEKTSVVNGSDSKDTCSTFYVVVESSLVETTAEKPPSSEESAYSKPRENAAASTFNGVDHVNEPQTLQYSHKQPLVASAAPKGGPTTSWKGCCGILELFSSSDC